MSRTGLWPCLALVVASLSACGSKSDTDQVRATVTGYAQAVATRDYQSICDTYLSPKIADGVERNAGLPCEAAIRPELSTTKNPKLTIRSIQVHGDRATVQVHTTAD